MKGLTAVLACHDLAREGLLVALIDRHLPSEQVVTVMRHLEACPACTVQFIQLMEIKGSVEIAQLWQTIRALDPQPILGPHAWW